jgi:hypothetical protein
MGDEAKYEVTAEDIHTLRTGRDDAKQKVMVRVLGQCDRTYRGEQCTGYAGHFLGRHTWQHGTTAYMSWSDESSDA